MRRSVPVVTAGCKVISGPTEAVEISILICRSYGVGAGVVARRVKSPPPKSVIVPKSSTAGVDPTGQPFTPVGLAVGDGVGGVVGAAVVGTPVGGAVGAAVGGNVKSHGLTHGIEQVPTPQRQVFKVCHWPLNTQIPGSASISKLFLQNVQNPPHARPEQSPPGPISVSTHSSQVCPAFAKGSNMKTKIKMWPWTLGITSVIY